MLDRKKGLDVNVEIYICRGIHICFACAITYTFISQKSIHVRIHIDIHICTCMDECLL